jgi:hypothetical protein
MQVKEYNIFWTFHKIEKKKVNCDLLYDSVFKYAWGDDLSKNQ